MFWKRRFKTTKLKNFANNKSNKKNIANQSFQEIELFTETLLKVRLDLIIMTVMSPRLEEETEIQVLEVLTRSQDFTDNLTFIA